MKEVISASVNSVHAVIWPGLILSIIVCFAFYLLLKRHKAKMAEQNLKLKIRSENTKRIREFSESNPLRVVIRKPDRKKSTVESDLISHLTGLGFKVVSVTETIVDSILSSKVETDQSDLFNTYALVGTDLTTDKTPKPFFSIDLRLIHFTADGDEIVFAIAGVFPNRTMWEHNDFSVICEKIAYAFIGHTESCSSKS